MPPSANLPIDAPLRQVAQKTVRELVVALLPLPLLMLFALLYVFRPDAYLRIVVEDGPVECLQAGLWFLSAAAGFVAAHRLRRTRYHRLSGPLALFAGAAIFVGAEEISWGQRICGWSTPEPFLHANLQEETTLHNLLGGQRITGLGSIAVGLFGACAWWFRGGVRSRPGDVRHFILPDWHCALYFLPAALFYLTIDHYWIAQRLYAIHPQVVSSIHQEVVELLLALGCLILALDNAGQAARLARPP